MPSTSCAYSLTLWLSFLQAALGIAIIGIALYVFVGYGAFLVLVPVDTLYISLVVGFGLIVVSIVQCCGSTNSRRGQHSCLILAFVLTLACFLAQIASLVLFQQAASLAIVQADLVSGALTNEKQIYYNNAILSTYVVCCTGCGQQCTSPPPAYEVAPTKHCAQPNNSTNIVCERTYECAAATDTGCIVVPSPASSSFPPVEIGKAVCGLLTSLDLVGSAYGADGCGGGSPSQFASDVFQYFGTQYDWALAALAVMCVLQGINLAALAYLAHRAATAPKPAATTATTWNARTDW